MILTAAAAFLLSAKVSNRPQISSSHRLSHPGTLRPPSSSYYRCGAHLNAEPEKLKAWSRHKSFRSFVRECVQTLKQGDLCINKRPLNMQVKTDWLPVIGAAKQTNRRAAYINSWKRTNENTSCCARLGVYMDQSQASWSLKDYVGKSSSLLPLLRQFSI